ncbi:phosphoribosylanthranilate isomerase [Cocleimonas flava]|uniref:N-(5'-phosphoribosyl)anthranilate isomerase n=1 Tax=Cocleimonas flava TaxID=634765 RepID=A0A4R1EYK8_9GAMM|nr:phosphoribosylanthranilate isomerase [Cocleimonas flava]TCJ85104.1 phosphoribosylanthranilate isomerase [Cocleimonas flava]
MANRNEKYSRTRVKICGITSVEAAQHVCASGADSIGLVFYEKSPRNVSIETATEIYASLPPFVTCVGLFLDPDIEFVETVLANVGLDLLQFHGSETPDFCQSFPRPYIKAIGMESVETEDDFKKLADQYTTAKGFLVDSHATGKAGGTGKTFDWSHVPQNYAKPIILAGGLNPNNVADAMQACNVYGIDLSSGVESQPGIKDKQKITQLMKEVQRVHCKN